MENMSKNQKIAMGAGLLMVISLFLPFMAFGPISTSLMGAGSFHSYVFLALGGAGLYFNYNRDTTKAKYSYLAAIGWFVLWIFINESGTKVFNFAAIGFYLMIASMIVSYMYTNKLDSGDSGE